MVVSVQGIFSMHLLARLKVGCEAEHGTRTFVDVGRLAFGAWGAGLVRVFLTMLQLGVCCVFINLVNTNIAVVIGGRGGTGTGAGAGAGTDGARLGLALALLPAFLGLGMVTQIRSMWPFSLASNIMMATAVVCSLAVASLELSGGQAGTGEGSAVHSNVSFHPSSSSSPSATATATASAFPFSFSSDPNNTLPTGGAAPPTAGDVLLLLGSLFFAYEGMALVLPVENSMSAGVPLRSLHDPERAESAEREERAEGDVRGGERGEGALSLSTRRKNKDKNKNRYTFGATLVGAMGTMSVVFGLVGAVCSAAYPALAVSNSSSTGSITGKGTVVILVVITVAIMVAITHPYTISTHIR